MMSDRTWIAYPSDIKLETELGAVYLTITERSHIYLDVMSNGRCITVRDRRLAVTLHLHREESRFEPYPERQGLTSATLYIRRVDERGLASRDRVSAATRRKVLAVLVHAVNDWAAKHPEILEQAQAAYVNNAVLLLEQEIAKLLSKVAEKREGISRLEATLLQDFQNEHSNHPCRSWEEG